jgi:hypothetical protein
MKLSTAILVLLAASKSAVSSHVLRNTNVDAEDPPTTPEEQLADMLDTVNVALETSNQAYRAVMADYITNDPINEGNTVISKDVGNKRLGHDFVPFDARRVGWSGPISVDSDDITYAIDTTADAAPLFGGLSAAQTEAAILRATATWNAVNCATLPLNRNRDFGIDIGYVAFQRGFGGSPFIFADIQHAGFRDLNFAGGVIGVTFTFAFIDGPGSFTDIDNNGRLDTAFREIYYDPSWTWADDGVSNIDVETVALHELGHGLSGAHFGKVFRDNKGDLKLAPEAVMNAVYTGPRRELSGTDIGGFCDNWANWPQN